VGLGVGVGVGVGVCIQVSLWDKSLKACSLLTYVCARVCVCV